MFIVETSNYFTTVVIWFSEPTCTLTTFSQQLVCQLFIMFSGENLLWLHGYSVRLACEQNALMLQCLRVFCVHCVTCLWMHYIAFTHIPHYRYINSYSASHGNWCTATLWNRIMTAQCEGMGDVGSARYEPALLPPCLSIRLLSYSNCQEIHSRQQTGLAV